MEWTVLKLDGGVKADLNWLAAKEKARLHDANGDKILWELDLGLFNRLIHPFSNDSQFLSLRLSIDHFREDIWPHYKKSCAGILIYSGPADYQGFFPWDAAQYNNLQEWLRNAFKTPKELQEETALPFNDFKEVIPFTLNKSAQGRRLLSLFCRDACVEYLNLLAANIPNEIPVYVELDPAGTDDQALLAQLESRECYGRLHILGLQTTDQNANIAVCLPPSSMIRAEAVTGLNEALNTLRSNNIPYRIIPEMHLITEWDGLDYLIICPKGVSPEGKRKLQGFCAAGGRVISLGDHLGLPEEMSFLDIHRQWTLNR